VFQKLLRQNRPLTITHPEVERFFMTIPEAVGLVLKASSIGCHRDILVLDMGEPMRVVNLAHTLIRLSGKRPEDVPIQFIGLRQGEKLYEELFYQSEQVGDTECEKIKRTTTHMMPWPELRTRLEELRASLYVDGPDPVRRLLQIIVPEFHSPASSGSRRVVHDTETVSLHQAD
jgi:FlaA1/EpsC-like NDP-sugar epimerase